MSNVLKNFFFLFLSKGLNTIVPIFIIPILIRRLGIENFGKVALIQSLSAIFIVFCNYAFELTAVKELILNKGNHKQLGYIVTKVILVRTVLVIFSFPIFIFCCFFFFDIKKEMSLILGSYCYILSMVFVLDWLFQGMQNMKFISLTNGVSKILYLLFTFLIIKTKEDYYLPNIILGVSNSFVILVCFIFFKRKFNIKFQPFSQSDLWYALKANRYLLQNNVLVAFYGYAGTIILGTTNGSMTAGIYNVLEKVILLLKSLVGIISQAVYPKICENANDFTELKKIYFKLLINFGTVYLCITILIFTGADFIQHFFVIKNESFISFLRLFLISALLEVILVPLTYIALVMNIDKNIFQISLSMALITLSLGSILATYFNITGFILSIIISQTMAIYLYIFVFNKINLVKLRS